MGFIIADYNDDLLVDLPTETLTSGPSILVRGTERESGLQETEQEFLMVLSDQEIWAEIKKVVWLLNQV